MKLIVAGSEKKEHQTVIKDEKVRRMRANQQRLALGSLIAVRENKTMSVSHSILLSFNTS